MISFEFQRIHKRFVVFLLSFVLILSGCSKKHETIYESDNHDSVSTVSENTGEGKDNQIETGMSSVEQRSEPDIDKIIEDDPKELKTFSDSELEGVEDVPLEDNYASISYYGMSDDNLRQGIQDGIYAELDNLFDEAEVTIEDIQSQYISKEYLEELAYNSRTNIFFGYSLEELKNKYEDNNYIFTLGEDGKTIVKEFSKDGNIYDAVIKDTLVGSGVILVCVTLLAASSVAAAPLGVSRLQIILSFSTAGAVIGGTVVGAAAAVAAGVSEYVKNGDSHAVLDASLSAGSKGFKWGAIGGTIAGTAIGTYITTGVHTPRESELFIKKLFPGSREQVIFKDGVEIMTKQPGSTVPDLVRKLFDGRLEAVEVKNYNLREGLGSLIRTLKDQLGNRAANMPPDTVQRLVLDVTGRGYNKQEMTFIVNMIKNALKDECPNLIISVVGFG